MRLVVGGVFLWAAKAKLFPLDLTSAPQSFSSAIKAYKVPMPDHMIVLSTFAIPWIELLVALALIIGVWTRAAALVVAGLLLLFIGLGISALNRGLDINCGCFGKGTLLCTGGLSWCHIVENSLMLALTLCILLCSRHVLTFDGLWSRFIPACSPKKL